MDGQLWFGYLIENLNQKIVLKPLRTSVDAYCRNCDANLTEDGYRQPNFCPNCGVKLDWTEQQP